MRVMLLLNNRNYFDLGLLYNKRKLKAYIYKIYLIVIFLITITLSLNINLMVWMYKVYPIILNYLQAFMQKIVPNIQTILFILQ